MTPYADRLQQLRDNDHRVACHDVYPNRRKPAVKVTRPDARRDAWENPHPVDKHDDTGFADGCVI